MKIREDGAAFGSIPDPPEPPDLTCEEYDEQICRHCSHNEECRRDWEARDGI